MEKVSFYFCGNEVSQYAKEQGFVDYLTFSKAFNHVLANDIMQKTNDAGIGCWEPYNNTEYRELNGEIYSVEKAEEMISALEERQQTLDEDSPTYDEEYDKLEEQIDELSDSHYKDEDIYQWYIVDDPDFLAHYGEVVFYNEELDMYLWGVDHFGTAWDYVLTDIPLGKIE